MANLAVPPATELHRAPDSHPFEPQPASSKARTFRQHLHLPCLLLFRQSFLSVRADVREVIQALSFVSLV